MRAAASSPAPPSAPPVRDARLVALATLVLGALGGAVGGACVFAPAPAPCLADGNCPDALFCVEGFCLGAPDGGEGEGEGEGGEGEGEAGEGEGEGEDCFELDELIVQGNGDLDVLAGRECVRILGDLDITSFFGTDLTPLAPVIFVGGTLSVTSNNGVTTLEGMEQIARIGGDLDIVSNNLLNDVTALENVAVDGDLTITSNSLLRQCDAEALAAAIADNGLGGEATVTGNFFDSCS